jgi:hypothetical protein
MPFGLAVAAGVTDEERLQHVLVSGNLTQLAYESPDGHSPLEIYTNYREGLEKAGFKVLYSCADAECGPLSPASSNKDESGRAGNRRVKMVEM